MRVHLSFVMQFQFFVTQTQGKSRVSSGHYLCDCSLGLSPGITRNAGDEPTTCPRAGRPSPSVDVERGGGDPPKGDLLGT